MHITTMMLTCVADTLLSHLPNHLEGLTTTQPETTFAFRNLTLCLPDKSSHVPGWVHPGSIRHEEGNQY